MHSTDLSFVSLIMNASLVVQLVMAMLVLASVLSWTIIFDRSRVLRRAQREAEDFENRSGFTYSILDGDEVIGCVYIYPSKDPGYDAAVSSWVCESRAEMDAVVYRSLATWLAEVWPFENPEYAARD